MEPVKLIHPDDVRLPEWRVRKEYADEGIEELAASIRQCGLLQPIVVRATGSGYELIAGLRRLAAVKHLGWHSVPAIVLEADDRQAAIAQLVENVQREGLNPVEEAQFMAWLIEQYGLTHEQAGKLVGKSDTWVDERIALLHQQPEVIDAVREGVLPLRAVRYLKRVSDPVAVSSFITYAKHGGANVETIKRWVEDWERQAQMRADIESAIQRYTPGEYIPPPEPEHTEPETFACMVCRQTKPTAQAIQITCCEECFDALLEVQSEEDTSDTHGEG